MANLADVDDQEICLSSDELYVRLLRRGLRLTSIRTRPFDAEDETLLTLTGERAYQSDPHYLGTVIGPYANRLSGAGFRVGETLYQTQANEGRHWLHGGKHGFHTKNWSINSQSRQNARFGLSWRDELGDFPGVISAEVLMSVVGATLTISYQASSTHTTIFNPTHHPYFNLAPTRELAIKHHSIAIDATHYLPTDDSGIPTGHKVAIHETDFEFRPDQAIKDRAVPWVDHCFLCPERVQARITHQPSGRFVAVTSDAPSAQIYTGGGLINPATDAWPYRPGAGLCIEPQTPPDAPNQPHLGKAFLEPGTLFHRTITYTFGVEDR